MTMTPFGNWAHICIDMQRMFSEQTPWHVPWMQAISAEVQEVCARHAARTIFTRFIPPMEPGELRGMWRAYYEKWSIMTRANLPGELIDLVAPLQRFTPPARLLDKNTYSPWIDGRLDMALQRDQVETIVLTGGETDVCLLATALGGIDLGYRVVVLRDAIYSSADETYDASIKLLGDRFSVQVMLISTEEFLARVG